MECQKIFVRKNKDNKYGFYYCKVNKFIEGYSYNTVKEANDALNNLSEEELISLIYETRENNEPVDCAERITFKPYKIEDNKYGIRSCDNVVMPYTKSSKEEVKDMPIIGNLTGPISTASSVIEPVIFYKELRKKNAEAHAYMNFVTEQLIAFGRAQVEAGADVITIADPSGTGEILGPRFFKEFAVRYINQLLDGLADLHVETIVHICGHMKNVYKEVSEVHSNALSFDSAVPMMDARKNLADRVLMGNVSTWTRDFGKPEIVEQLAVKCWRDGSGIISPACGLGTKSPLTNIQAIRSGIRKATEEKVEV